MSYQLRGTINFPRYTGARCYMMPFIQGRGDSLPSEFLPYADIIERTALDGQEGEVGLITIDESFVEAGSSQRGYGAGERTIHTEACVSGKMLSWGPTWGSVEKPSKPSRPEPRITWGRDEDDSPVITWGRDDGPSMGFTARAVLSPDLRVLIANSISDTCMVWDRNVFDTTPDGDLSARADEFPREQGRMMAAGELMEIGIFTPHEPIRQRESGERQFFRIVGRGVYGREPHFTENPLVSRFLT